MTTLNTGPGRCHPTHQLSIRPVQAVLDLGAVRDVIHAVLNAAHHTNRHAQIDERIAVALPDLQVRRGVANPGHEIVLFGSQAALDVFAALEGVQTLHRRSMIKPLALTDARWEAGAPGTAYVRDRAVARRSPGAIRRAKERAARRGVAISAKISVRAPGSDVLALHFGDAVVHVREIVARVSDRPLLVSTYGFSAAEAPAVLPIQPNRSVRWHDDDAA